MSNEYHNVNDTTESAPGRGPNLLGLVLALLLAVGAFFSGLQANQLLAEENQTASIFSFLQITPKPAETADLTQFWRVWQLLEQKYITANEGEAVSVEDRINGAIQGLVGSYGDPYTLYLPPADSAAFAEDISGNFGGIGMEVGLRDGIITVIAPLVDTPAYRAGIIAGDRIVKIDNVSTDGMRVDEAVRRIRGERGTAVTLSIFREGASEFEDYTVVRDTITIPTVKTEQEGDVFVIRLYSFNAVAEGKMREAVTEYVNSGLPKLVLDLRGNPGGYLQSAVAIAGSFLPSGKVVARERSGSLRQDKLYRSQGRPVKEFSPSSLVVLIDSGSASASEILAGALREHGVATLIGMPTFGKGSVQELVDLPGGSALKVTVARWLTPEGISISEGGLKPDFEVKRTPDDRAKELDPQFDAALRFLRGDGIATE